MYRDNGLNIAPNWPINATIKKKYLETINRKAEMFNHIRWIIKIIKFRGINFQVFDQLNN